MCTPGNHLSLTFILSSSLPPRPVPTFFLESPAALGPSAQMNEDNRATLHLRVWTQLSQMCAFSLLPQNPSPSGHERSWSRGSQQPQVNCDWQTQCSKVSLQEACRLGTFQMAGSLRGSTDHSFCSIITRIRRQSSPHVLWGSVCDSFHYCFNNRETHKTQGNSKVHQLGGMGSLPNRKELLSISSTVEPCVSKSVTQF